jgi:hypothetical protein
MGVPLPHRRRLDGGDRAPGADAGQARQRVDPCELLRVAHGMLGGMADGTLAAVPPQGRYPGGQL